MENSSESISLIENNFVMKYIKQNVYDIGEYSSSYSNYYDCSYSPSNLMQEYETTPVYGDYPESYMLRSYGKWKSEAHQKEYRQEFQLINAEDFIIVKFKIRVLPRDIYIYEVYNPGAVVRIWAQTENYEHEWIKLWEGIPEKGPKTVRIFSPPLKKISSLIRVLKLELNQSHLDYHTAIGAIQLGGYQPITKLQSKIITYLPELLSLSSSSSSSANNAIKNKTKNDIQQYEIINRNYFQLLSDEIILHVFQYLDIKSLCRCAQVNKRWNYLSKDYTLYQNINLKAYWNLINPAAFTFLMDRCKNLKKLDCSWCNWTNPYAEICSAYVQPLITQSKDTLTHLCLNDCYVIDAELLDAIMECHELTELRLHNASEIYDYSGWLTSIQLTKLITIDLSMTLVQTHELKSILLANPNLEHLNIDLCINLDKFNNIIEVIVESNKKLKSWSSWKTGTDDSLTSDGVKKFGECPNLVELDLGFMSIRYDAGDDCLIDIANGCKKLKRLVLTKWRGECNQSLLHIIESCKELTYLDLVGIHELSLNVCEKALYMLPKLRLLDISYCDRIPNEEVNIWRQHYPHIDIKKDEE